MLGQFSDLRGKGLSKKDGVVFLRAESWYPNAPMHTMPILSLSEVLKSH